MQLEKTSDRVSAGKIASPLSDCDLAHSNQGGSLTIVGRRWPRIYAMIALVGLPSMLFL